MCSDKPIRGRVQRILDKIINTFRSSGNKRVGGAANKVKTSQEREKDNAEYGQFWHSKANVEYDVNILKTSD